MEQQLYVCSQCYRVHKGWVLGLSAMGEGGQEWDQSWSGAGCLMERVLEAQVKELCTYLNGWRWEKSVPQSMKDKI